MSSIKNLSMFLCMLLLITCSKESDVASDTYASNASQNTYTPPTTTTTSTTTTTTVTQFTLAVTATEGGSVSSSGGTYDDGTSVTITATANEGYRFTGWEGSDSTSESLTVTLNSDQTYQALFELIPVSVYTISVSAQGSANYILTGDDANGSVSGNDPSVSLKVGDTFNFNVNAQGHPFYLIKTSDGGVGSSNLIDGVSNNGAESATVSWTPTEAGTYYYICEYHSSMLGTITVTE